MNLYSAILIKKKLLNEKMALRVNAELYPELKESVEWNQENHELGKKVRRAQRTINRMTKL